VDTDAIHQHLCGSCLNEQARGLKSRKNSSERSRDLSDARLSDEPNASVGARSCLTPAFSRNAYDESQTRSMRRSTSNEKLDENGVNAIAMAGSRIFTAMPRAMLKKYCSRQRIRGDEKKRVATSITKPPCARIIENVLYAKPQTHMPPLARKDAEAAEQFKAASDELERNAERAMTKIQTVVAADNRTADVFEDYMALLARSPDAARRPRVPARRPHSRWLGRRAWAASSALGRGKSRLSPTWPPEQDLQKQVGAQAERNKHAEPAAGRARHKSGQGIQARSDKLRAGVIPQSATRKALPDYAN